MLNPYYVNRHLQKVSDPGKKAAACPEDRPQQPPAADAGQDGSLKQAGKEGGVISTPP